MDKSSSLYRVHQCSKCRGDTEYYCVSCACNMCLHCKVNHLNDLETIDHDIVTKREKINSILTKQICERLPCENYCEYCEPCALPLCKYCTEHKTHRCLDIQRAYQINRQEQQEIIHTIRREALFQRTVLLTGIKVDVKTCLTEFDLFRSEMLTKAQRLKNQINKHLHHISVKHRCLKQKIIMNRHIVLLQRYEHKYEQSSIFPIQFLLSIKTTQFHKIHLTIHISKLSVTELPNRKNVIESLTRIQITDKGDRRIKNECMLKLMPGPELHQSLAVSSVNTCEHIPRAKSALMNTKSVFLHSQCIFQFEFFELREDGYGGSHTVNNKNEIFYIDCSYNISKLSKDMKTTSFIKTTGSLLEPRCLYWSTSSRDLLVVMIDLGDNYNTVYVNRYNQTGQLTHTIQHNNTGYSGPLYITENNNEDVVVSYKSTGAVVVTERGEGIVSPTRDIHQDQN